jgi:glycosyltransferase involved in cell wall biosynthesis
MSRSTPVKIAHVVLSLGPGGMENGVVNLARSLPPEKFTVRICCLESGGEFVRRLPDPGRATVLGKPPGLSVRAAWQLAGWLRREKPAVIHTHNLGPLIYAVWAKWFGATGVILHGEHGMITEAESSGFHLRLRRLLYMACRKVHTVSHGLRHYYIERGFPADKIVAVVNGVDTSRFVPGDKMAARKALGLPESGIVVGMVASLQRRKRHREMIEAFEQCAARHENARLLLLGGDGPESGNVLRQIAASPQSKRIHWAGYQEDTRLFYQAMDLLAVPSVNEGLSNAALEAMASGVPVLAHSACGNPDIIENELDGFVANLATTGELFQQLERAISSPEQLIQMGKKARAKVVAHYSLGAMVSNYASLYLELAGCDLGGGS